MSVALEREFEFFLAHRDDMFQQYGGHVIGIKDGEVLGVFDSELAALTTLRATHQLGTFLIQRVQEGDTAVTQTFHSPAVSP